MKKKLKNRHKITFVDDIDVEVAVRGQLGQYTRAIARETGLTESQVQYRLTKATVKRSEYRDGTSWAAQLAMKQVKGTLATQIRRTLPQKFGVIGGVE